MPASKVSSRVPKTSPCSFNIIDSSKPLDVHIFKTASIFETQTPIPSSIASSGQCSSFAPTTSQDLKQNSKRKKRKNSVKTINQHEIEIKMAPHKPRRSSPIHDSLDEDMIEYMMRLTGILAKKSRGIFK
ncbi:hypothetical protein TNCV_2630201 [Trichonephila clavipes]|uniref:Uncharacterized protein n=1 Tax=Trichonephila clavipes TaxID=2585209 RepID=A0A8X6VJU8_TRICX|nr:hypothetical protein TNCV_2630201 [Trichonephila clavipes]